MKKPRKRKLRPEQVEPATRAVFDRLMDLVEAGSTLKEACADLTESPGLSGVSKVIYADPVLKARFYEALGRRQSSRDTARGYTGGVTTVWTGPIIPAVDFALLSLTIPAELDRPVKRTVSTFGYDYNTAILTRGRRDRAFRAEWLSIILNRRKQIRLRTAQRAAVKPIPRPLEQHRASLMRNDMFVVAYRATKGIHPRYIDDVQSDMMLAMLEGRAASVKASMARIRGLDRATSLDFVAEPLSTQEMTGW